MAVYRNANDLAKGQAARFARVRRSQFVEIKELAQDMRAEAIRLTSGTISTGELKSLGHPFARSRGRNSKNRRYRTNAVASAPKLPINKQTGRLQNSIRLIPRGGGYTLQFTAPYSQYILNPGGTKTMVARGFWTAMRKVYDRRSKQMLVKIRAVQHA